MRATFTKWVLEASSGGLGLIFVMSRPRSDFAKLIWRTSIVAAFLRGIDSREKFRLQFCSSRFLQADCQPTNTTHVRKVSIYNVLRRVGTRNWQCISNMHASIRGLIKFQAQDDHWLTVGSAMPIAYLQVFNCAPPQRVAPRVTVATRRAFLLPTIFPRRLIKTYRRGN